MSIIKKIKLYFNIKKFYNTFAEEVGSNFITKLSDMTDDNVMSVIFDINEILDANANYFDEEAYALDAWLAKLKLNIQNFRHKKPSIKKAIIATLQILLVLYLGWTTLSVAEILTKNLSDYNFFAVLIKLLQM